MFYQRLKLLIEKQNKSFNQVERELGYPKNALNDYKKGKIPSAKRANEIAEYFDVSVDYLLGLEEEPQRKESLTTEESELVGAFRMEQKNMTPEEQVKFAEAVKDFMKYAKERLNDDSIWKK